MPTNDQRSDAKRARECLNPAGFAMHWFPAHYEALVQSVAQALAAAREDGRKAAMFNMLILAIRAIEKRVGQLDEWADGAAKQEDYSGACRNQTSAVDLHCAVDIITKAIAPHSHGLTGFNPMVGDTCTGCEFEEYHAAIRARSDAGESGERSDKGVGDAKR